MISSILALSLFHQNPVRSYSYPLGSETKFQVKVQFDGYIPLFGGKIGKADVDLTVSAKSVLEKDPRLTAVESQITELKAVAFGVALPLNKNNIGQFFPKATATIDLNGMVKSNSAPAIDMPVKLPGLDSQRLPEISYVPLVLNTEGLLTNKPYEFDREFNHAKMHYTVTPGAIVDAVQSLDIKVTQDSDGFEDSYGNPSEESIAKSKLVTHLEGTGKAKFNIALGKFDKVVMETNGATTVTNIKSGKTSSRSLKTTLTIVRDGAKVDK